MMSFLEKLLVVVMLGAIVAIILSVPWHPTYGFAPWPSAPRIEFSSELDCWQWLARARGTKEDLRNQSCTPGESSASLGQIIWRAMHH